MIFCTHLVKGNAEPRIIAKHLHTILYLSHADDQFFHRGCAGAAVCYPKGIETGL